jgi:protease-4
MGTLEMNGLVSEPIFFSGALQKYGIGVQVVRVGSYKSAIEPYTRSNLSPENKQQLQELLGNIWQNYLQTVGKSRNLDVQHLQEISNNIGLISSKQAKTEKLIDIVGYYDDAVNNLKNILHSKKDDDPNIVSMENYLEIVDDKVKLGKKNKIAIIYAEGNITDGQGGIDDVGGDKFAKEIRNLKENKDIKAVVLRINSPGGSANASDVILREVQRLQAKKPVVVSMGNVAASGGYWMATGGQYIFAEDDTITGSIGVFGMLLNWQKLANNNGITWDLVKTSKLADINTNIRPKTGQEIALYQKEVNRIYDLFLDKVSKARHLSKERVQAIAQGRVWSGYDAKKIGLVDQIGGLEDAVKYTAQLAKLGDNWQIEEYPEERSWKNIFIEKIAKTQSENIAVDPLEQQWYILKGNLDIISHLNDPHGVYLILPFKLDIN